MIKVRMRRFIARYFSSVVRVIVKIKIRFTNLSETCIVLTIGKVGSTSVYESLRKQRHNVVFHLHCFTEQSIIMSNERHLNSERKSLPLHLIIADELYKKLGNKGIRLKIITLIREPISRYISAFFQNTEMYKSIVEKGGSKIDEEVVKNILLREIQQGGLLKEKKWFDTQIKEGLGIDVFEQKFDVEKAYKTYSTDTTDLLLIRMEDLNKKFKKATAEFFDNEGYELIKSNIAESKFYYKAYKNVKQSLVIPDKNLEEVFISKFFEKFYHDKREKVIKEWKR